MQAVLCLSQTNIIFILLTKLWDPCTRKFQSFLEETLWLKSPWQCCFKQLEEEVLVVSFNIDIVASIINSKPLWSHIWILSEGIRKADTLYLSFVFLSKSTFSFSSGNLVFKIPSCLQIQTMEIECFFTHFSTWIFCRAIRKMKSFQSESKIILYSLYPTTAFYWNGIHGTKQTTNDTWCLPFHGQLPLASSVHCTVDNSLTSEAN